MSAAMVERLKDDLLDAVRRAYVGDKPWFSGPPHLGLEVTPEAVALEPAHMRRIAAIHEAVCQAVHEQLDQPGSDLWALRERAFYRGWRMAMELVAGEAEDLEENIPDAAVEALQPCRHDAITGRYCDWCGEVAE